MLIQATATTATPGTITTPLSRPPDYTPSGVALPPLLLRHVMKSKPEETTEPTSAATEEAAAPLPSLSSLLASTAQTWAHLQSQIQRGEDCYVEEAGIHNIYKGWEGYMDTRVTEAMPKRTDHRWCSAKCTPVTNVPYVATSTAAPPKIETVVMTAAATTPRRAKRKRDP